MHQLAFRPPRLRKEVGRSRGALLDATLGPAGAAGTPELRPGDGGTSLCVAGGGSSGDKAPAVPCLPLAATCVGSLPARLSNTSFNIPFVSNCLFHPALGSVLRTEVIVPKVIVPEVIVPEVIVPRLPRAASPRGDPGCLPRNGFVLEKHQIRR